MSENVGRSTNSSTPSTNGSGQTGPCVESQCSNFEKESNKSQTENDKHPSTCHGFHAAQNGLFLFEVGTKFCTSPSGKLLSSGAGAAKNEVRPVQRNFSWAPRIASACLCTHKKIRKICYIYI